MKGNADNEELHRRAGRGGMMNIKKAIKILRGFKPLISQTNISYDDYLDYDEAIHVIDEKINQYEWHDLRKNPEDLPELLKEVFVCTKDSYGNKEYTIARKVDQKVKEGSIVINGWSCLGYVIAWREIEPFEMEVEDDIRRSKRD